MFDAGIYEIDAWGEPVGDGVTAPRYCTLAGVVKFDDEFSSNFVANEYICGRLGLCVGLPVPPGVLVKDQDGRNGYVSLRFGKKGQPPPGVIPEEFCADHPKLAAGIISFDCWIGNRDRHDQNLAYSRKGKIKPAIFDHSHALLIAGAEYLIQEIQEPVISGCLISELETAKYFRHWADRIRVVSDGLIEDMIEYLRKKRILNNEDAKVAQAYLLSRKYKILEMVKASHAQFNKIPPADWSLI